MSFEHDFNRYYLLLKTSFKDFDKGEQVSELQVKGDLNGHAVKALRDCLMIFKKIDECYAKLSDQALENPSELSEKTLKRLAKYVEKSHQLYTKLAVKTPQAELAFYEKRPALTLLTERMVLKGIETNDTHMLQQAVDQGADFSKLKINYRGKEISPLACALELISIPCIDFILKKNPGLAQQPLESGMLPLTHALERSSIEAVALLLASQADPYRSKKK